MRILTIIIIVFVIIHSVKAAIVDLSNYAADGLLSDGEYAEQVTVTEYSYLQVRDNGGAYKITVENNGLLDIFSTSLPLSSSNDKGVWSILLTNSSTLNFSGGATNLITTKKDSMAYLSGGQINLIASQQVVTDKEHIIIDCKPNWIWKRNSFNEIKGIVGYWHDDAAFDITFLDQTNFGYNPVYENVKVIPEPGTLVLLSLGGLFLKRRRQ